MTSKIASAIGRLKAERNAVILAHNYQLPEVQDVADYTGDSLGLSRTAARTRAAVVMFCGVHFMAETAAILCPGKKVIIPDANAGCPMANMITPRQLAEWKKDFTNPVVVTYVNSSAAVKALSDVCCTSANAVAVVRSIPEDKTVLFVPDRNLGNYVSKKLGRRMELWNGFCPTHERILPEMAEDMVRKYPDAEFIAHPECRPAVAAMADLVASTTGMLNHCRKSERKEFIIGTEIGILHPLTTQNPGKKFYPVTPIADCANMKLNTLEKILWALEDMAPEITVPEDVARAARRPIQRMLEVTGDA